MPVETQLPALHETLLARQSCASGHNSPTHPPMHPVQRGVSGIRRYVSWRRRSTRRRLEPPAEVDHKKSTEEETAKKVG